MLASSDLRDLPAFFALLPRVELGRACAEDFVDDGARDGAGGVGGEGLSVPQASQRRYVDRLTRVQMSQVQVSLMGGAAGLGAGFEGRRVGGGGLVETGMGGLGPKYFCRGSVGEVLGSDSIGIGAPWLPQGFSALGGM